jgi:transposase
MALSDCASSAITNVITEGIGFAPILRYYFEKCGISRIIDENVPIDPRRKVLSHGQAAVAMITAILFQVMQLYRISQFADESTVLDVILPGIKPEEYFDDRLADTLDSLYAYGLGDIELLITRNMIDEFQIRTSSCHNDTTSASYYGMAGHNRNPESIQITFGHSKKHRDDLKQLIWSMSVSSDSGFPLFQQAYHGNTADVNTYVAQWENLIDLLGRRDFLYVADCKLISKENVARICDNEGYFLAPAPMYDSYARVFETALAEHDREELLPYKEQFNRGFETPITITHEGKDYPLRMIILYDHGVAKIKRQCLENHKNKTLKAFEELNRRANHYRLKTHAAIKKAADDILKKYSASSFFTYQIINTPVITYKNNRRGRPSEQNPVEKTQVISDHFQIQLDFNAQAFDAHLAKCGYYPLLTNQGSHILTIEQAMIEHKDQYKNESTFRRAKSSYNLEPIYLHYPERIESYLFLFKIALQIVVLIERTARHNLQNRDRGLDNFMPNRKDVRNPRAEYLLSAFQYVVKGLIPLPDGKTSGFVSELTPLQLDILDVLDVPQRCFSYHYLINSS